jgi:hypothetical protein
MTLFDTADGCFMNFAYGWAFARPVRKVYYNLVITGLSIAVAFLIGTIEICGLLAGELHIHGGFWDFMTSFDINKAGFAIAGLFVAVWAIAIGYWKLANVETRWTAGPCAPRSHARTDRTRQPEPHLPAPPDPGHHDHTMGAHHVIPGRDRDRHGGTDPMRSTGGDTATAAATYRSGDSGGGPRRGGAGQERLTHDLAAPGQPTEGGVPGWRVAEPDPGLRQWPDHAGEPRSAAAHPPGWRS